MGLLAGPFFMLTLRIDGQQFKCASEAEAEAILQRAIKAAWQNADQITPPRITASTRRLRKQINAAKREIQQAMVAAEIRHWLRQADIKADTEYLFLF